MRKKIIFPTEEEILRNMKMSEISEKYWNLSRVGKQLFMDFCTGRSLRALTYDAIFKKIFNFETHPRRLEQFLSALMGQEVHILQIMPLQGENMVESGSVMIMDIVVKLEDGSIVDLEIQKVGYKFTGKRDSCYLADLVARQYQQLKGKANEEGREFSYDDMKPVYTIILLEHSPKEMKTEHISWEYNGQMEFKPKLEMDFLMHTKYIALDKFKKIVENKDIRKQAGEMDEKSKWLYLISAGTAEEVMNASLISEEFLDIISEVAEYVQNVKEVMNMFSNALYMLDRNTEKLMYDEWMEELKERDRQIKSQSQQIKSKNQQLESQSQQIKSQSQQLKSKDQQIESQSQQIESQSHQIEALIRGFVFMNKSNSKTKEETIMALQQNMGIDDKTARFYTENYWDLGEIPEF